MDDALLARSSTVLVAIRLRRNQEHSHKHRQSVEPGHLLVQRGHLFGYGLVPRRRLPYFSGIEGRLRDALRTCWALRNQRLHAVAIRPSELLFHLRIVGEIRRRDEFQRRQGETDFDAIRAEQ